MKPRIKLKNHRVATRVYKVNAGETQRLIGGSLNFPMTADHIVERHWMPLIAKSREVCANDGYAKEFLKMCRNNVVGAKGIELRANIKDTNGQSDGFANTALEQSFKAFSNKKHCDIQGRLSLRAIQNACITSAARDGEFFIRFITGTDLNPWGIALQVLDPIRCPIHYNEEKLPSGNYVKQGIEFNQLGRPIAYHFTHVGTDNIDYNLGGHSFVRIPAAEIIHGFLPDLLEQKRGLPWTATALMRLKMLSGMEDATLVNARASASKGGFLQWRADHGPMLDEDDGPYEQELEPNTFKELPPGLEFKDYNPHYPSGEAQSFSKRILQGIAASFGVTYNDLAKDLENVNFSSIRQGTLNDRDYWKELQAWLIEELMEPLYERWLYQALINEAITIFNKPLKFVRFDKYLGVDWQGRSWDWIDPRADTEAAIKSIDYRLKSVSQVIRERGDDPEKVFQEMASDIKAMQAAGIPDHAIPYLIQNNKQGASHENPETLDR